MKAMILAAGLGERLRPHTLYRAKPSLPLLNVPLLGYAYYYLQSLNLNSLVVNTHHQPDSVHQAVQEVIQKKNSHPIHFTLEAPCVLGSGGGIKEAEQHLTGEGNFLVANGDEFMVAPQGLKAFWEFHEQGDQLASLLVCHHDQVGKRFGGVWVDSRDRVLGFGKTPCPGSSKGWHFTGFIALSERVFDFIPKGIPSNILHDILHAALVKGESIKVFHQDVMWWETGSAEDFLHATQSSLELLNQQNLWSSCLKEILSYYHPFLRAGAFTSHWFNGPISIREKEQIQGTCFIDQGVTLGSSSVLEGFVVVGAHSRIGENALIKNSVLGPGIIVKPNQRIENQLVFTQ